MSQQNPLAAAFELQRRTLEQSQVALEQSIEFQKQFNQAIARGMENQADAQQRSLDVTRRALDRYLDTIEAIVPGADAGIAQVREAIDEQFDTAERAGEDAYALAEEGVAEYEDVSEAYLETVSEQIDLLAEAHADVEEQTLAFLDETDAQLEELADQAEAQLTEQVEGLLARSRQLRDELQGD